MVVVWRLKKLCDWLETLSSSSIFDQIQTKHTQDIKLITWNKSMNNFLQNFFFKFLQKRHYTYTRQHCWSWMQACMRKINIPINKSRARQGPQKLLFMFPGVPAFTGRSEVKAVFTPEFTSELDCSGSHVVYLKATASQTYKKKKVNST